MAVNRGKVEYAHVGEPLRISLRKLALLAARGARVIAARVDLTPQRLDLLLRLYERPLIQRDIAFELGVGASVVSRIVDDLEGFGLVERRYLPHDKRLRLVRLTRKGVRAVWDMLDLFLVEGLGCSSQGEAERHLVFRFHHELRESGFDITSLTRDDNAPLLFAMRERLRAEPLAFWDTLPRSLKSGVRRLPQPSPYLFGKLPPSDEPPCTDDAFPDVGRNRLYRRHWEAGLPLTAEMRARKRYPYEEISQTA